MGESADIEVLVVGAGPTGLMLANQLARRGVSVLVVDRNPGPSVRTKALGVQGRTLEIYDRLGVAGRALELGVQAAGANMWVRGRRAARVPLGDIGRDLSPYPFLLILGQDDNERILGERLRTRGIAPRWDTELVALEQAATHVSATLKQPDGSLGTVRAAWVAGCDGAHSAVRRLNGIEFPGAPYEHVFFVADTRATGPMVPGELNVYLWRDGFHLLFPMRGADHWRVVGILPPDLRGRDDLEFDAAVPDIARVVGSTVSFRECSWFATYRIHHRRAARFRQKRCFLLGDAAHIHSPVGAQGMNTGLQDAYNLGWKLALVAAGRADARLLDSYAAEREPVAERLLQTTDRAFSLIVSDGWLAGLFRMRLLARILAFAMGRARFRRLAFRTISQIGIHYRGSPLSQTAGERPRDSPAAGDRFPWLRLRFASDAPAEDLFARLDDTRFSLLLFGQPAPAIPSTWLDLLLVHEIPADPGNERELGRAGIAAPSFYLLRPDGHVGLAGTRGDSDLLAHYLSERLGLALPTASESGP
jgi:2-polyprenyl-6-methoxyphenol hydroxylase-like FAD-dependent oxidoreductase